MPNEEIREAFRAGFNHEIWWCLEDQAVFDIGFGDVGGVEASSGGVFGNLLDSGREFFTATEPDTDLDGGVCGGSGVRPPDGHVAGALEIFEGRPEGGDGGVIEDTDVDEDLVAPGIERPSEKRRQGVIGPLLEEVLFGDDKSDLAGDVGITESNARREVSVVDPHASGFDSDRPERVGPVFGKVKWASAESRGVTGDLRRAVGYALVGALVLIAPILDSRTSGMVAAVGTIAPFAVVTVVALASTHGRVFEWFARTGDREGGRLYGLASFALAVTALAVLVVAFDLPIAALVGAVFILTIGNLGQTLITTRSRDPVIAASAFAIVGTGGGAAAILAAAAIGSIGLPYRLIAFVAASGAILGALIRWSLYVRDDSLVLLSSGLIVWFLIELDPPGATTERVAIGLGLTFLLGYIAYALGTASVTGMLTGVLLALFAVVLGGYGWFVLLVTFFGLGGLSSKYRYEEKLARGIAQQNAGARGSGNVLANSAVALIAVVAYAASGHVGSDPTVFQFAFAGAVAAALADTFSSEFGGLVDDPRLITTFEHVEPGTDGGVTWQGMLAGIVGAGIIAVLAWVFFTLGSAATVTIAAAGTVGMVVDSILGATLEGNRLDNQGVNLLATLVAGLAAGVASLLIGVAS